MATNYAKQLVIDKAGTPYQNSPPAASAIARYVSENATASSFIGVTDDTTAIEIASGGVPTALRWVPTTDTQASVVAIAGATANFDHIIPPNTVKRFVIPVDTTASVPPQTSQVGANRRNQLYQRFAWKTQGIGSVYGSEFQ